MPKYYKLAQISSIIFKNSLTSSTVLKYDTLTRTVPFFLVPIALCIRGAQCNPLLTIQSYEFARIYAVSDAANPAKLKLITEP